MKDVLQGVIYFGIFAIPLIPLFVASEYFFPFITGKNFTFRIIVEIMVGAWVILAIADAQYRPRFSWLLATFGGLLAVMFFANYFGENPVRSFWSNFERMEGYVSLVHVFAYLLVVGSFLGATVTKNWFKNSTIWNVLFHVTLVVASVMMLMGLQQVAAWDGNGDLRVDSQLGNAAYMAIYMFFHAMIALYLAVKSNVRFHQAIYAVLAIAFAVMIFLTGTRGTVLALIGGLGTATGYVALFGASMPLLRKWAVGAIVSIMVLVGGFQAIKDSDFVQNNNILKRFSTISLEAGDVRFTIWSVAWEGVKERPYLGWGQGNFGHVFAKHFDPALHSQEPWFDRVHNIVFDWLVAGGVLGATMYFSVFVAIAYYLFWRPVVQRKGDEHFSLLERSVLSGLFVGYLIHNIFVFDNIVSFIFFSVFLAYLHARVSAEIPSIMKWQVDKLVLERIVAPVVVVAVGCTIYFANVPGMLVAGDIIDAIRLQGQTAQQTAEVRLEKFKTALERESFATQEIREQMAQRLGTYITNAEVASETQDEIRELVVSELEAQIERVPSDVRAYTILASFHRQIGEFAEARQALETAHELSPTKQQIILEQGFTELQAADNNAAHAFFKQAFELDESYVRGRIFYTASSLYTETPVVQELIVDAGYGAAFARDNFARQVATQTGNAGLLVDGMRALLEEDNTVAQRWVDLALVQSLSGDKEGAKTTLNEAVKVVPELGEQLPTFIQQIDAGTFGQ